MSAERYLRHGLIPGWDQSRLGDSTVVVVGVGALGNEVARILAQAGVGRLILCDHDRISTSNLSRTVLFRDRDVGRLKVEAAAESLAEIAPGVRVEPRPARFARGVGLAELRDANLVLGCLDSRSARVQLASRCGLVGAKWIDAATNPWGGEVRPYLDPDGPCYACTLTSAERSTSDIPISCTAPPVPEAEGASAPTSGVVGSWQALIATRFLMGLPCPAGTLEIDAQRFTTRPVKVARDPRCPCHTRLGEVSRIAVGSADRVADLRSALRPGEVPQMWEVAQERVRCLGCGFDEVRWGIPEPSNCPRCGEPVEVRGRLHLGATPGELPLATLGIPPREILPVLTPDAGIRYVELRG